VQRRSVSLPYHNRSCKYRGTSASGKIDHLGYTSSISNALYIYIINCTDLKICDNSSACILVRYKMFACISETACVAALVVEY